MYIYSFSIADIFIADEPTSGLDVSSAKDAVQVMKNMSESTVICTIHQPSSDIFQMFDKLMLLADGGQVAFFGPLDDCLPFFSMLKVETS